MYTSSIILYTAITSILNWSEYCSESLKYLSISSIIRAENYYLTYSTTLSTIISNTAKMILTFIPDGKIWTDRAKPTIIELGDKSDGKDNH